MTTREKKRTRNRTHYRFGYYKERPVFIKYKRLNGEFIQEARIDPIGHIYLLRDTYRRFLSILRRRAARAKNIRRQQLMKAAHAAVRSTLSSRS